MPPPFQLVRPGKDPRLAFRGLRVLVGGPESAAGISARSDEADVQERVNGFLAYAKTIDLDVRRQVIAMEEDPYGRERIMGMCLWVPSPGRAAMLFGPALSEFPEAAPATQSAIEAALCDARDHGVNLVQAMMEPSDAAGKTVFSACGLWQLGTLSYMERRAPTHPPVAAAGLPPGWTLAPYSEATHEAFRTAIARSYIDTLDCPLLSGLREIDDVIAGHKAVGTFDPQLWSVLLHEGEPLGCLLLAEITARQAIELVYLGLAPDARGKGLGRALMNRLLALAAGGHYALATLAVDAANGPALRLYRRFGYASVAQRVAMIRKLV